MQVLSAMLTELRMAQLAHGLSANILQNSQEVMKCVAHDELLNIAATFAAIDGLYVFSS